VYVVLTSRKLIYLLGVNIGARDRKTRVREE